MVQQVAGPMIIRTGYPCLRIVLHAANLAVVLPAGRTPQNHNEVPVLSVSAALQSRQSLVVFVIVTLPFFESRNSELTFGLLCCTTTRRWTLPCPSSWTLLTDHFVRLLYRVVGHVPFMVGFCLLTDRYICLC